MKFDNLLTRETIETDVLLEKLKNFKWRLGLCPWYPFAYDSTRLMAYDGRGNTVGVMASSNYPEHLEFLSVMRNNLDLFIQLLESESTKTNAS